MVRWQRCRGSVERPADAGSFRRIGVPANVAACNRPVKTRPANRSGLKHARNDADRIVPAVIDVRRARGYCALHAGSIRRATMSSTDHRGEEDPMRPEPYVERVVRYPVKGLPGVPVAAHESVALEPGRGLRWDRSHAIEHGLVQPGTATGWNPRETYFHLAKHERIAAIRTSLDGGEGDHPVLTLTAPDGRAASVDLGGERDRTGHVPAERAEPVRDEASASPAAEPADAARAPGVDGLLAELLPAGPAGPPALVRTAAAGLWDWPAAHLSIINLATVDALAEAAGEPVDPRRFRGNLYLGGLPAWGELALLGRRIRLGDAVLEVFQVTDRCRATTINPLDAVSDLNVPALLASRFGHMFCGVYARVVEPGRFAPGDPIELVDADPDARSLESEPAWPRTARVVARRDESSTVTSIWLSDPLGFLPAAKPGQHVRVHLPGAAAPSWRCYTISAVEPGPDGTPGSDGGPGRLRISVKRDGRISTALHDDVEIGGELVVTGPFGDVTLDPDATGDLLFVSAGAGITPTVAMLRALAAGVGGDADRPRRIRVLHVERTAAELPLWDEVRAACAALGAEASVYLTRDAPEQVARLGATAGRPGAAGLAAALADLDVTSTTAYVCGPGTFTADVRATLDTLGVAPDRVHAEVFFSPTAAELTEPQPPSTTGPHRIALGDDVAVWRAESGSVLDAVEGIGVDWPSGCRVGACGTCARVLRAGEVEYLTEPLVPPPAGSVLVCCTAPTTDVVFEPAP
jgi:ferredoxin-NADP reductase/uncharacterized protein YcbX